MKNETQKRTRNTCITWNNPKDYVPQFNAQKMTYLVYQYEIGSKMGTPHWQMYVELKNPQTYKGIQKIFGAPVSCQDRRGTADQAADYCKKERTRAKSPLGLLGPQEFGEMSKQGERTDLQELANRIMQGGITADEILEKQTDTYHMYGRTIEKLEDLYMRRQYRTEMTQGIWIHGETDVGKSHSGWTKYPNDMVYDKLFNEKELDWWDGYKGEPVVLLNDFRGEMKYGQLLNLLDKWPHKVSRRGREPTPFMAKLVIITSPSHPAKVYRRQNEKEDSIKQLERRLLIHHKLSREQEIILPDLATLVSRSAPLHSDQQLRAPLAPSAPYGLDPTPGGGRVGDKPPALAPVSASASVLPINSDERYDDSLDYF